MQPSRKVRTNASIIHLRWLSSVEDNYEIQQNEQTRTCRMIWRWRLIPLRWNLRVKFVLGTSKLRRWRNRFRYVRRYEWSRTNQILLFQGRTQTQPNSPARQQQRNRCQLERSSEEITMKLRENWILKSNIKRENKNLRSNQFFITTAKTMLGIQE